MTTPLIGLPSPRPRRRAPGRRRRTRRWWRRLHRVSRPADAARRGRRVRPRGRRERRRRAIDGEPGDDTPASSRLRKVVVVRVMREQRREGGVKRAVDQHNRRGDNDEAAHAANVALPRTRVARSRRATDPGHGMPRRLFVTLLVVVCSSSGFPVADAAPAPDSNVARPAGRPAVVASTAGRSTDWPAPARSPLSGGSAATGCSARARCTPSESSRATGSEAGPSRMRPWGGMRRRFSSCSRGTAFPPRPSTARSARTATGRCASSSAGPGFPRTASRARRSSPR